MLKRIRHDPLCNERVAGRKRIAKTAWPRTGRVRETALNSQIDRVSKQVIFARPAHGSRSVTELLKV